MTLRRYASPILSLAVALSLIAAACGGSGSSDSTTTSSSTTTSTTTATSSTTTSTIVATTTSTLPTTTTTTLPGLPFERGPAPGDVLAVVGVSFDSVLNLRSGPGTDFEVLKKLAPRADRVISNGRAQDLPNSLWYEVTASGVTGWSSATYLAYLGTTDDITADILVALGDATEASSMEVLGERVAGTYPEEERRLRVSMSGAPSIGDLGEVIYDVIGFADDSVYGVRLHVFGQATENSDGYILKSVEATSLCLRGVTDDRLCV